MLPHPPYSPDLAPCDFFLFPHLKSLLRGRRFRNVNELQAEIRKQLRQMDPLLFAEAIEDLPIRWQKCVLADGAYFEGQGFGSDIIIEPVEYSDLDSEED